MTLKELRDVFEGDYTRVALFDEEEPYEEGTPLEFYDCGDNNLTDKYNDCRVIGITTGCTYNLKNQDRYIIVHLDHGDVVRVTRDERFYKLYEVVYGKRYTRDRSFGEQNLDPDVTIDTSTAQELIRLGYLNEDSPFGHSHCLSGLINFIDGRDTNSSYWSIYVRVPDVDDSYYTEPTVKICGISYTSSINLTVRDACDFANAFHHIPNLYLHPNNAYALV